MKNILSDVEYYVTSNDGRKLAASNIVKAFENAAIKEGFRLISYSGWDGANVASFQTEEDVPFDQFRLPAADIELFVSAAEDILGKRVSDLGINGASAFVKKETILASAP